jgi:hypothetical protein
LVLALLGAAVALVACGGPNTLDGSVSELFPTDVSNVEVVRNGEAFQVSYYVNRGSGVDLVARVTVATEGLTLTPGTSLALDGEYAPGHLRTTVVHMAAGEPLRTLPPVEQGDLQIEEGGDIGQTTTGNFSMSFQAGDYGGGRNLYGTFQAVVQDGGFGPDPFTDGGN